ncbi:hypothetical protein [Sporocytophaga myxococcoides]|uniref:hypothetical protein n=1 Tax=Sporocytophaga myxococcoides TaxID=153721 RepID=UPI00048C97BF|nr:hypothetical protein [Sporocytophaga myxococcoides]
MIASLDFLPEYKQEELKLITDLIVEKMKPAKLLLFGSYARNTWAEEEKVEEGIYRIDLKRKVKVKLSSDAIAIVQNNTYY